MVTPKASIFLDTLRAMPSFVLVFIGLKTATGASGANGAPGAPGASGAQGATGSSGSATLTNVSNNRVMTAVSGTTLNAEANLTFDGDKLILIKSPLNTATINTTNCLALGLRLQPDNTTSNTEGHIYTGLAMGDGYAGLYGKDGGSGAATDLEFFTGSNSAVAGRMRIQDDGKIIIGGNVSQSINRNVTIVAATGNSQDIQLGLQPTNSSGGYNPEVYIGATADGTYGAAMYFYTRDTSGNRAERLRITSAGNLKLPDGAEIQLGNDTQTATGDLRLFHNGSNSGVINSQGALYIQNTATNSSDLHLQGKSSIQMHCPSDGDVRLRIKSDGRLGINADPSVSNVLRSTPS